ncbi:hypothetical protein ONZ43_g5461 [Nemania bipapillata]|uniref:Uncharacterized protein n=1 Tax=Nemania bipapillata TaxID=110536 RepID=A0ACC2IAB9_9PEZI|nr:hypothetical protein ONZ43_g5461 [Nemania bipapillata]
MAGSEDPRIKFGLSCPEGGNFFICEHTSTRFIGCCGVDPCTSQADGLCPSQNLYDASFSSATGVMFLPQSCADPYNSSIWYTCNNARPPFLGCCMNDPCNNGCEAVYGAQHNVGFNFEFELEPDLKPKPDSYEYWRIARLE